ITFEGATGGGGVTENRIYDNSYEYRLNVGPGRFASEVQAPTGGNSAPGLAYQGDVGFDYMGFSMDFLGGHEKNALSASPLSTAQVNSLTSNQVSATATPIFAGGTVANGVTWPIACSLGCISGVVSDNT